MITDAIINIFVAITQGIFTFFPALPDMPSAITTTTTWITDAIGTSMAFLNLIFTHELIVAAVIIITTIALFEKGYFLALWAIKKIPWINIK